MNDWTQGYVSDIEYLPGFYVEQTPAHLDVVCLLRGVEPPVAEGKPFTYCELGCGVGETALAIGAANPGSDIWGFDFNPAHIARGRDLAEAGGLGNVHLREASFEELASGAVDRLPQFDYIALHGVWSWVSHENRSHIVRFIDRHLKPGGLVYVTYNALPGWTASMPLQKMLSMLASLGNDRSDRRVNAALDMARDFAKAGAGTLSLELLDRLDKERASNLAYLSHEYLNEHWSPCYQMDVARDMAAAKLSYVGTANMLENFPDVSLTPEQREMVARLSGALAETAKDFFMTRTFRRDVFIRGPRNIPERRLEARVMQKRLCLVVPPHAISREVKIPLGEATLNERFYQPALEALIEAPRSIGELMNLPATEGSTASAREVLGMLIGSRQAMSLPSTASETQLATVRAYNAAHLRACAEEGRAICALVGVAIGSAVTVRLFEMLAYEALADGAEEDPDTLTAAIWQILQHRGDRLRHEGEIIEDDGENIRILRENVVQILAVALPMWRRVGAI